MTHQSLSHYLLSKTDRYTLFLNNLYSLNRFADFFLKEWQIHSKKMEEFMIDFGKGMGPQFFKIDQNLELPSKTDLKRFLADLGLITGRENINY